MPLYLRTSPGAKKGGDITGPYDEANLNQLRQHAQSASSQKSAEIFWVCGRRRPMLLASYQNGAQKYPRNKHEERQLENVTSCMFKPGATIKSSERSPREITSHMLSRFRKLPNRFTCPAKIVSSTQFQELQMPTPIHDVGGEQHMVEGAFGQPISPIYGRTMDTPGYLYDPLQSLLKR